MVSIFFRIIDCKHLLLNHLTPNKRNTYVIDVIDLCNTKSHRCWAFREIALLQIKPKDMDELTATIALSHGLAVNPYIYTYMKIQKIHPFTYPRFTEMDKVKEILSDTHGILSWKEQKEEILAYIDSLSDEEKGRYIYAIKIILHEIELRQHSLSNRRFFRNRAMICYKLAYIKTHFPEEFTEYHTKLCAPD